MVGIDLVGYNIAGPISPSLGMLSSLMYLNLSRVGKPSLEAVRHGHELILTFQLFLMKNYLSGRIPNEIGSLPYLVTFKVNHNRLSGQIPRFVSSKLTEVNVSHNVLEGIDHFYVDHLNHGESDEDSLNELEILDASYNEIAGNIPEGFKRLTQLHHLDLSFNKVSYAASGIEKQLFYDPNPW